MLILSEELQSAQSVSTEKSKSADPAESLFGVWCYAKGVIWKCLSSQHVPHQASQLNRMSCSCGTYIRDLSRDLFIYWALLQDQVKKHLSDKSLKNAASENNLL